MSFWRELLFFQSCGSLSFSGQLDSTIFLQRLGELSMSLSSPLKLSIIEIVYTRISDSVISLEALYYGTYSADLMANKMKMRRFTI